MTETILYVALAILGIGLIIFIHEAGHFLAAKKVGVRVERFALGFDPVVRGTRLQFFSFRRGETEYVLGMIPFGGYVKMAGEILPDPNDPSPPHHDELLAKSVGARALVFVAGAVMNLLSAFVFFMIAFTAGVKFAVPEVGDVQPDSPAAIAGLRSGDRVLSINGKPAVVFQDLVLEVALGSGGTPLELEIERNGQRRAVSVTPEYSEELGMYRIGVEPPVDAIVSEAPAPDSPAGRAGLAEGDRFVGAEIAGYRLPELPPRLLLNAIEQHSSAYGDAPVKLFVERDGATREITIDIGPAADAEPSKLVQVVANYGGPLVRRAGEDPIVAAHLREGDRVSAVNGHPAGSFFWRHILATEPAGPVELTIQSKSGEERRETVDREEILRWSLDRLVDWSAPGLLLARLEDESPLKAAGYVALDTILSIGDVPVHDLQDLRAAVAAGGKVRVLRGRDVIELDALPTPDAAGAIWCEFPALGSVRPDGPAGKAGIEPGSRVFEFAGQPITSFAEFHGLLGESTVGAELPIAWLAPDGTEKRSTVKVGALRNADLGIPVYLKEEIVKTSFAGSFAMGIQRTVAVGKQVFLTLRSLIRRDVAAKNLSGPIGITHVFTRAAENGWESLIYFMAMVSVNLGLLNLLPFPILDGGHLLFLLIEKIKGSPVSIRVQELATSVAFFCIIALFLFVTFHDVKRFF